MRPELLKEGDRVAIVAPAGRLKRNDLDPGLIILHDWGLDIQLGRHVYDDNGFFSATDENRLQDLQQAINSPEVKAIFCARGGYGLGKIIDSLQLHSLLENPKWIIGFSDITLLHFELHKLGLISVHGPMVKQFGQSIDQVSVQTLREILFSHKKLLYNIPINPLNHFGDATGKLIGGNLSMIANNIGTKSDTDFSNKILFVEEINENIYVIDRLFNQLERADKLMHLKALIAGQFTGIKDTTSSYGKTVYEVISAYMSIYNIPVLFDFPAGHESQNLPLIISSGCRIIVNNEMASIEFLP